MPAVWGVLVMRMMMLEVPAQPSSPEQVDSEPVCS